MRQTKHTMISLFSFFFFVWLLIPYIVPTFVSSYASTTSTTTTTTTATTTIAGRIKKQHRQQATLAAVVKDDDNYDHDDNDNNEKQQQQQQQQQYSVKDTVVPSSSSSSSISWKEQITKWIIRKLILDTMKESKFVQQKHQEHISSKSVVHMFQSTPLSKLDDALKLQFVSSYGGKFIQRIMEEEQEYLKEWKIEKIIQAAGIYYQTHRSDIQQLIQQQTGSSSTTIVMYSFIDCPWCIAAKSLLLQQQPYSTIVRRIVDMPTIIDDDENNDDNEKIDETNDETDDTSYIKFLIVELEILQEQGKAIRAELAQQTGRTSLPSIFINGTCIGGYTDGYPGLLPLHESGQLIKILDTLLSQAKTKKNKTK